MENTHGDKLLEEVQGHIERCGQIGMAALADGQSFVAGQAFTACKLAERVRDVLSGNHTAPLTNVARLPFDKPAGEKAKRQRKPKASAMPVTPPQQGKFPEPRFPDPPKNGHASSESE